MGTAIQREAAATERPIISSALWSTGKLLAMSSERPGEEHIETPPQVSHPMTNRQKFIQLPQTSHQSK
jgi:hypothetical protein